MALTELLLKWASGEHQIWGGGLTVAVRFAHDHEHSRGSHLKRLAARRPSTPARSIFDPDPDQYSRLASWNRGMPISPGPDAWYSKHPYPAQVHRYDGHAGLVRWCTVSPARRS